MLLSRLYHFNVLTLCDLCAQTNTHTHITRFGLLLGSLIMKQFGVKVKNKMHCWNK